MHEGRRAGLGKIPSGWQGDLALVGREFGWSRTELDDTPIADLEWWLSILAAHPAYELP